jgi:hypothetical protein
MDRNQEPDEQVRAAAQSSLNRILPSGNVQGLKALANQFRQEPQLRLNVLKVLVDKLREEDPQAVSLAVELQNLGEVQADPKVNRQGEAVESFKSALEIWEAQGQPNAVVEGLKTQYLRAMLRSAQYSEAAEYSTEQITKDTEFAPTVFQLVRIEAEDLRHRDDLNSALRLVGMFKPLKMGRLSAQLAEMEAQMQRELNARDIVRPAGTATGPRIDAWMLLVYGASA